MPLVGGKHRLMQRKTAKKKQRDENQAKQDATNRDISQFFSKGAVKAQPKAKVGDSTLETVL